ncbi:MAG TPA: SCO family protein [Stellaceae bacterium]|nr:SCO family protein [Stellaceae bacterium]
MHPSTRRGLLAFLLGLALLIGAFSYDYWQSGGSDQGGLAGVSFGGPFTLTDQNGVVRRDGDFRGELMLVYFGYTYCPDACPTALTAISAALDMLGERGRTVQPIFITIDPARDTVAQMKIYAANFTPRLLALTGTSQQIATVARAYRVYYAKVKGEGEDDYAMDHSDLIYLMGRDGRYLNHFSADTTAAEMAAAIKKYL